jgi:hypothetical protein
MKGMIIVLILLISQVCSAQNKSHVQPFLPDIFGQFPNVRDFTISSSEDEAYFTAQSYLGELSVVVHINKENGKWSEPEIVPFSGKYQDLEPFLSPNGSRLFFASNRPLNDSTNKAKDFDIWYVQRENRGTEWSSPINIGRPVNSEHDEFYPCVCNSNNLYFTSDAPNSKGKDDIFLSEWKRGRYLNPVPLSDSINTEGYEFNAYIAPDESFILFSGYNREDGFGSGDLYISYQNADGIWSKAKNPGSEINSDKMDYCPFVDMSRKTLYFTSKRSQLDYQLSGFETIKELLREMNKYENGLSRIYKVPFEWILVPAERRR